MRLTWDSRFKLFKHGAMLPFNATKLILEHRELKVLSVLPIVVSIVVFALLIGGTMNGVAALFGTFLPLAANVLIQTLALILVLWLAVNSFVFILSLVASPFNDLLAERTERLLGFPEIKLTLSGIVRVFWLDLRKTSLGLFLSLLLTLLTSLPLLGLAFLIPLALLTTFNFVTYALSRRGKGVRESLIWIREHVWESLGFGSVLLVFWAIPLMNIFALPVSIVGGTLLVLAPRET